MSRQVGWMKLYIDGSHTLHMDRPRDSLEGNWFVHPVFSHGRLTCTKCSRNWEEGAMCGAGQECPLRLPVPA